MDKTQITLRPTTITDLEQLFLFQLDEEGQRMAAFMPKDANDKDAYIAKYTRLLNDPTVNQYSILVDGVIAGSIARFVMHGDAEITYWIDKRYWGRGVATMALEQFLIIEHTRPLYGRAAFDNTGSQRVMERCGFVKVGTDKGFASARGTEIEEYIYRLDS